MVSVPGLSGEDRYDSVDIALQSSCDFRLKAFRPTSYEGRKFFAPAGLYQDHRSIIRNAKLEMPPRAASTMLSNVR